MDALAGAHADCRPPGSVVVDPRSVGVVAAARLVVSAVCPAGSRTGRGGGGQLGEGDLAPGKATAGALGAWLVFEDEAAVSMTSHRARTWAPRGSTPTVRFNGASRGRISMAALVCFKAGGRSRLIYRPRVQGHHRGAHRGFTWQDYRDLLVRAHLQLAGPVVVIRDNLNVHRCSRLREYAAEHDWLTIVQPPSYAPDLNPVEGIWSLLRRSTTAHVVFRDRDHLVQAVRSGLRCIQRRTDLIEGCLTETGLSLTTTTQRKGQ